MSQDEIAAIAVELVEAGRTGTPMQRPTARFPDMNVDDAYAVQRSWRHRNEVAGRRFVGHKIGLTSVSMQTAMGLPEPDYGVIFDDMVVENGASVDVREGHFLRVEVELAFVMKKSVSGPGATLSEVLDATEYVVPALEIVDSRIEPAGRTVVDSISDNASASAIVLGDTTVGPRDLDLRWTGAILYKNARVEETGLAAGVLDNPATGLCWLADKIAARGEELAAGEIVLAGSFTRPISVHAGDRVLADYGPLGNVTCQFE